jgi:hypothetical protein
MFRRSLLLVINLIAVHAQDRVCLKSPPVFSVTSAKEAADLAEAAACRNATVSAAWQSGKLQLLKTIQVGRDTNLTVTGEDAETAIVDGRGKAQLFNVRSRGHLTIVSLTLKMAFLMHTMVVLLTLDLSVVRVS